MEIFADFVKIVFPSAAVMFAMYITVKSFLAKDFEKQLVELRTKNTALVLPVRLQAYERVCLLLERISPHNLILRVNNPAFNAIQLQQKLLLEIREEFNHNLSQQVYMSNDAWNLTKHAMEEIVAIINTASQHVDREAQGVELAKAIFEVLIQRNEDPSARALRFVKDEIRQVF